MHAVCAALAGRAFFRELDRDGDGRVTLDDMKAAMRRRNLPEGYARQFMESARGGRWWSNDLRCWFKRACLAAAGETNESPSFARAFVRKCMHLHLVAAEVPPSRVCCCGAAERAIIFVHF